MSTVNTSGAGNETEEFGRSTLDVHNRDDAPVWVKVSKTLGRGHDGYFRIEPGATERWRRHVGRRVTIKIDYFGDGDADESCDHTMGISSADNAFEINGGVFSRVGGEFESEIGVDLGEARRDAENRRREIRERASSYGQYIAQRRDEKIRELRERGAPSVTSEAVGQTIGDAEGTARRIRDYLRENIDAKGLKVGEWGGCEVHIGFAKGGIDVSLDCEF
jgi:hypothetical protein